MRLEKAILFAATVLAGCAPASAPPDRTVNDPPPPAEEPAAATARVDENLARLEALQIFEIGELLVKLPEEASNCYGPCPGSEGKIAEAERAAAERLDRFTDLAEAAAVESIEGACDAATIDANLAALDALEIVDVLGLLVEEPKNDPQCYNLPCPGDVEAAQAKTCERAGKLASIAKAAKGL